MKGLRFLLPSSLFALASAPLAWSQDVKFIRAEHRAGQTFVTWRESSTLGTRYRVYRSSSKLTNEQALDDADFLGEVDEKSSRNQGRSLATGAEHEWIITPGGSELGRDDGLFVYTVESASSRATTPSPRSAVVRRTAG